ncbi:alpha/beta fold hydrolase [Sulfitobacter sp. S190]|uniref:alpha/beta hydrolase family protein n=1 Tax=Sulfitobacter sp. S190 TaxID=2867022 RepID=UPI0021A38430|nr:alpha/beta fold hydrolase [Sulfitobacter sp. S190]UWR24283.1 dienelactone hydrolase family protein [Sulfitobacter sp. S190]
MPPIATLLKTTAAAVLIGAATLGTYEIMRPPFDGEAGITYGKAFAPARGQNVDFHVWYPAHPGGKKVSVGGNGVFYGTDAGRGAPQKDGQFPVIIMSHGAGGNAGQFGWIASRLAEAGYVVVLPNHPGTTTGNASAEAAVRVWERPADITAVLDEIINNAAAYPFMDTDRIATLGFSAGGYTSLALAGARVDPERLQRFCDDTGHGMSDCAFLAHFGIDLHSIDLSPAAADLRDPRISAAVVVDPGIVSTLTEQSLSEIAIPMLILNLGDADLIPAGVDARDAANLIATASYRIVPDATHFSFLAECKAKGPTILEREGELDALCDDAGGRSREEIHAELAGIILAYLGDRL